MSSATGLVSPTQSASDTTVVSTPPAAESVHAGQPAWNMAADGTSPRSDSEAAVSVNVGQPASNMAAVNAPLAADARPKPDETSAAQFRSVRSDGTAADALEKQIAATEARLEAYDASDAAQRETRAAAQEVAYAKKLTEVRKQAEQRVAATASFLELGDAVATRMSAGPEEEKQRVHAVTTGMGCEEVDRVKSWFTKCWSKKRVEFRGTYYCCPTNVVDSSTWDETINSVSSDAAAAPCTPGTAPKAAKVLGCEIIEDSSNSSPVDCSEAMKKLAGVDYDTLRNDYDRFKHACDDIRGSLQKYVREELAKPRDQIQPPELQHFLTKYSLPANINEGICHLPSKAQGTLAAEKQPPTTGPTPAQPAFQAASGASGG